jgi:hypothetical protein
MTLSSYFYLCGEVGYRDPGCGCDLSLILRTGHEEDKLPHLRDDLHALLHIKITHFNDDLLSSLQVS